MATKRILFHSASLGGGGAERVFVLVANEMARRGHDVHYLTWNGEGPNRALLSPQVQVIDLGLPLRNQGFGKAGTLRGLWRSVGVIRALRPDALFSAPEFANALMAIALRLARSGAAFFPTYHAAGSLPSGRMGARLAVLMSRLTLDRADKAVAVSAGVGRDVAVRNGGADKVVVINNPLPPAMRRSASHYPWEDDLAALSDGPVIVTAGRFVAVKDQATLLSAFAHLRRTRPARLVMFGDGPLGDTLRRQAAELGIADHVLFPGYVNEPAACYAVADLFVLSSTSEGFGNVLVEAMAAGVPVVSTDAPHGPREILKGGALGPLVPVGDAGALAAAMSATLDAPLPADLLKARAADFSVDKIGDRYEALLG